MSLNRIVISLSICITLILLFGVSVQAATPVLIQHVDASDSSCSNPCSSSVITLTSSVTNGNRVFLTIGYCASDGTCTNSSSGANITSVAGSANLGTFVQDKCVFPNGIVSCIYSAPVTGTGATAITVTMSGNTFWYLGMKAAEFSNIDTVYLDQTGGQNNTGTSQTATTAGATAASGELILGFNNNVNSDDSVPTGYTDIAANHSFVYKIGSSAQSEVVTWPVTGGGQYTSIVTANIPTVGGGARYILGTHVIILAFLLGSMAIPFNRKPIKIQVPNERYAHELIVR